MCLTGTTPGGRGRLGSCPYSLSEHPWGRNGWGGGGEGVGVKKGQSVFYCHQNGCHFERASVIRSQPPFYKGVDIREQIRDRNKYKSRLP